MSNTRNTNPLAPILARQNVVILDGALATELERHGHDISGELWSARLLIDEPDAVRTVHADYIDAGADIIIAASYQATLAGFARVRDIEDETGSELIRSAVQLALDARGDHEALVAASVGPYGATLADGSEYTGDYDLDEEELYDWHSSRFELLATSGADVLAMETIPSLAEARALLRLLDETPDAFAWLSFSCRDGEHVSDGTPFAECVALASEHDRVIAVGLNCTAPQHVEGLVTIAAGVTSTPIIVYPNSGESWDAGRRRWTGDCSTETFADHAIRWQAAGARIIGGCCRTGPAHVRELRARLGAPH